MTNENNGDKESCMVKKEDDDVKRRLWRRFCPKLWFSTIWKKLSISPKMIGVKTFLEKNAISASIALALGLCYLLPKLKGSKCIVAPYSDLLVGIRDGSVTRVQFKENSRSVFYKRNLQTIENEPVSHENSFSRKNGVLKLNIQDILADMLRIFSRGREAMPKHDQEKRGPVLCNQVPNSEWQFSTRYVDDDYRDLLALMKEKGTTYGLDPEPLFISAGRRVLTTLLNQAPSWAMLLFIARGLGGGDSIARKPNKKQMVTFDDVEGVDAAKIELMEIVSCLQGDTTYSNLGAKIPRGVLLVGPPGTGKTLLARAVAEKAGVPFFITCASEFVELFVGRGASRIRNLFKDARKHAPSIIFIDELDAVGLKRGKGFNTEGDQTLNQLLTEMDGFESDKKVVVIAATNRAEMLDPALLRPGRFSRKVYVREPDEDGRRKILAVHFRGVPLEEDKTIICNLVASLTQGFVGADLANIVNEAALLAGRRGANCVSREDIMEAIKRAKVVIRDSQHQHRERYEQEGREIVLSLTNGGFDSHGLDS